MNEEWRCIVPERYKSVEEYESALLDSLRRVRVDARESPAYNLAVEVLETGRVLNSEEVRESGLTIQDPQKVMGALQWAYLKGVPFNQDYGTRVVPLADLENLSIAWDSNEKGTRERLLRVGAKIERLTKKVESRSRNEPTKKSKPIKEDNRVFMKDLSDSVTQVLRDVRKGRVRF